jgi:nucleoid-associated protein YgaU
MRYYSRSLLSVANAGGDDMDERAAPDAKQLYRPSEGESLYQIARKTLGAATAWRLIADRNNLDHVIMHGDELLIIPARGQG